MKTILVPHDFSDMGKAAAEEAAKIGSSFGAKLTLLHMHGLEAVLNEQATGDITFRELDGDRKLLDDVAEDLKSRFGVEVETKVELGVPADGIVDAADRLGAELIVMGTHGRQGLSHLVLGSVAEKVVRRAKCSVLVAKAQEAA